MLCPYCQKEETKVIDSRETENFEATRRRRECLQCSKRFTTYERVETDLKVIKKDGTAQQYSRDKLIRSISIPCEKRPIDEETINKITNKIEAVLRNKPKSEVTSKAIGELSMRALKRLDKIAYIRFASVYRDFEDIESFEAELIKLKK